MKFIQHYMGERQLLKNVSSMSNVQHGNEESWQRYYKHFNKILADNDQVISEEEVVREFIRGLGLKGTAMKDSH